MSNGFQCIGIVGGLGKDPEIRSTPNGKKVASFSVAVNEGFGNSAYVEWFNVIAWNELAEFVEKYLKKGKQVSVTGKFKTRSWDDASSGQKKYRTELIASQIQFMDSVGPKPAGEARAPVAPTRRETPAPERRAEVSDDPFADEDEKF